MTKNKPELKPCPFKHRRQALEIVDWGQSAYRVYCYVCCTIGPYAETKQWAIRKWNARSVNHDKE